MHDKNTVCHCVTQIAWGPKDQRGYFLFKVEDSCTAGPLVTLKTTFNGSVNTHEFLVNKSFFPELISGLQRAVDHPRWCNDDCLAQGDLDCLGRPTPQTSWYEMEDQKNKDFLFSKTSGSPLEYLLKFIDSTVVNGFNSEDKSMFTATKGDETLVFTASRNPKVVKIIFLKGGQSEIAYQDIVDEMTGEVIYSSGFFWGEDLESIWVALIQKIGKDK